MLKIFIQLTYEFFGIIIIYHLYAYIMSYEKIFKRKSKHMVILSSDNVSEWENIQVKLIYARIFFF